MANRPNGVEKFWSRVDRRGETECWNWRGTLWFTGYGRFVYAGSDWKAHRLAWMFTNGPTDECVLHRCDNRRCVNPAHLFLGTLADNNADKVAKGRQARGQRKSSKLSEVDVIAIRGSSEPEAVIAQRFGITPAHAGKVRRGQRWSHV